MSRVADKKANRSAIKANLFRGPLVKPEKVHTTKSWWIDAAAPDAREKFIELAHERNASVWTSVSHFKTADFR